MYYYISKITILVIQGHKTSIFTFFYCYLTVYVLEPFSVCFGEIPAKGQIISKWFLMSSISSKKTNEGIRLYYYDTPCRLVFVRFLEEIEDTKKPFRNYLTFKCQLISKCLFGVFNSLKKRTKTIRLEVTYHSSKVEFFGSFF